MDRALVFFEGCLGVEGLGFRVWGLHSLKVQGLGLGDSASRL